MRVEFGKAREERVASGDAFERGRDEGRCLNGGEGREWGETSGGVGERGDGTCEDGEFPGDVEAVEVVGWMGFLVLTMGK